MTKYFRFLVCLTALVLSAGLLKAQAPYKFAYQAIVRSESNQIVRNTQVDVRIAILKNAENGAQVYKEKQSPKTNENGLYTIVVGGPDATSVMGTIKDIEWGNGVYFIKAEVDVDKDGTYDLTTIQQLVSVPYVFHANVTDEGLKDILANGNSGDASHNTQIKCLANPTDNNDVVNKAYLDSILAYIDENYGGCKLAEVKLSDITATENGCGTKLKVKTTSLTGSVSYQWYRDGSPISGATSASYDASNAGTYKVVATATCDGGTPATAKDEKSTSVTASGPVIDLASIKYSGKHGGSDINSSGTSVTVDQNSSLTLTADLTEGPSVSYSYNWTPSGTGPSITPSTTTVGTTTYMLKVIAEDENGCKSEESKSIDVTVEAVSECPKKSDITPTIKITTSNSSNMVYALKMASTTTCKKSCDWTLSANYTMSKTYPGATVTYQWAVFSSSKFWSQSYNDYCGVTKSATTSSSVTGTSMAGASGTKHFGVKVIVSVPGCSPVESDPAWVSPNVSQCY